MLKLSWPAVFLLGVFINLQVVYQNLVMPFKVWTLLHGLQSKVYTGGLSFFRHWPASVMLPMLQSQLKQLMQNVHTGMLPIIQVTSATCDNE